MKKSVWIFLLIVTILSLPSCTSNENSKESIAKDDSEEKNKQIVNNLVKKYNAIVDWKNRFYDLDSLMDYSYLIQKSLLENNRQPIIFEPFELKDIYLKENVVRVQFEVFSPSLILDLEVNEDQILPFLSEKYPKLYPGFVVATVFKASKIEIQPIEINVYSGEDVATHWGYNNTVLVEGKCLEIYITD